MRGTGGVSSLGLLTPVPARFGLGERKVRSVNEPELPGRRESVPVEPDALPTEPVEFFLTMRFVWICPTSVGLVGLARRAAAAAAADKLGGEVRLAKKACDAAVVAAAEGAVAWPWWCLGLGRLAS
jgi:hypothetical protein